MISAWLKCAGSTVHPPVNGWLGWAAQAAQACIDVIRSVDTETPLYVEGNHWSGAQNWATNNPTVRPEGTQLRIFHTLNYEYCGRGRVRISKL